MQHHDLECSFVASIGALALKQGQRQPKVVNTIGPQQWEQWLLEDRAARGPQDRALGQDVAQVEPDMARMEPEPDTARMEPDMALMQPPHVGQTEPDGADPERVDAMPEVDEEKDQEHGMSLLLACLEWLE